MDTNENAKISDEELENISGGEYDSGEHSGLLLNYYVFDTAGNHVDHMGNRDDALNCARRVNGFVVSGSQTDGTNLPHWRYEVNHKCIFASDGFMAANPGLTPHYDGD